MNAPDRQYGMPLPGPIESFPLSPIGDVEADEMLTAAVRHAGPVGAVDRQSLRWLAEQEAGLVAVFASLLRRAWQQGLEAGRSELLDEAPAVAAAQRRLADLADVVDGLVDRAEISVGDGGDPADLIEQLTADLRTAVEGYARGGDRLAKVADTYLRKYRAIIAGEPTIETRQLAFVVAVESAAALTNSDAELAEAVRAIVAADQEADAAAQAALQAAMAEFDADVPAPKPARRDDDQGDENMLQPGSAVPGIPGFVVGVCGHRIAGSEWAAGYRTCGHCPADEGNANVALLLLLLAAAVVVWVPLLADPWQAMVAAAGAVAGVTFLRRVLGICRACGHRGAWRDPLTLFGRPRVHVRHLPNIRESRRASRAASRAVTLRPMDGDPWCNGRAVCDGCESLPVCSGQNLGGAR